jgi:hypothetical protein
MVTPLEMAGEKGLDPKVRKEVADLMLMMENWKKGYSGWNEPEFAADEMERDIDEFLFPYVNRLWECGYIDRTLAGAVMQFAYKNAHELRTEFDGTILEVYKR